MLVMYSRGAAEAFPVPDIPEMAAIAVHYSHYLPLAIGRTHECLSLPWQEEQEPPVRRVDVEHPHAPRAVVPRQDDVRPSRRRHGRLAPRVLDLPQVVGEGPPGEDDAAGAHVERPAVAAVLHLDAAGPAVGVAQHLHHLGVVGDAGPVLGRREGDVPVFVYSRLINSSNSLLIDTKAWKLPLKS